MHHTKPEACGEIDSVPSPLSLVLTLVPMACGLELVPSLVEGMRAKVSARHSSNSLWVKSLSQQSAAVPGHYAVFFEYGRDGRP